MKILSAFILALCFSTQSNAQVNTSGELIDPNNWSGATYGVDPGGCCASISGAGPLYDTSTNTIMFSYGNSTISQNIGLEAALGAQGILLHGYNYSWDYRLVPKSNGTVSNDYLFFNTRIRDAAGNILFDRTSNYSGAVLEGTASATWQTQSGTISFEPLQGASTLSLSISGYDGGFWAGYYGPEVRNVSMSVNYSVDPCINDPLYSSSCPGYLEAFMAQLAALLGWGTPEPEMEVASISPTTTSQPTASATTEDSTRTEPVVDAGGIEVTTTGELSVPDGIPESVKEDKKEKKSLDPSLLANILREATDDSKALSVVNQSIQNSLSDDANPDFSMTNETLAAISRQRDISIEQMTLESQEASQSSSSNSNNFGSVLDENNSFGDSQTDGNTQETEIKNTTPVQVVTEDTKETNTTTKKNIQDNEAAGDVSIEALAQAPIDFNDYLNQQMKDISFYLPKEIYKGQKNVDNARLLRGLTGGSDKLHQQMVEEQYR